MVLRRYINSIIPFVSSITEVSVIPIWLTVLIVSVVTLAITFPVKVAIVSVRAAVLIIAIIAPVIVAIVKVPVISIGPADLVVPIIGIDSAISLTWSFTWVSGLSGFAAFTVAGAGCRCSLTLRSGGTRGVSCII